MNYELIFNYVIEIMVMAGIIALGVSLLTEFVVKKLFSELRTFTLNIIVTVLSIIVTYIIMIAYIQVKEIMACWYIWTSIFFLGCFVAAICMNGYDKVFSYIYEWIKNLLCLIKKMREDKYGAN